ncbi:uncharacterized protein LOC6528344 [Drosophila yakuba]|uniref:Uncharacterized protein, isoform A n=1 Tax=Drosophila yakuba TaxID=7245 RepID=B4P1A7_DROYA|nr:uncharacterized protein LOC6528344 [Drosophila yakuba]EDW89109.2 uncharacterized protein Dyak_GE24356, isoform A [Drosophila yakuba]
MVIMIFVLLLLFGVISSWATDYELMLEDPDIFSPCTEGPPGSIDARQAVNFDDLVVDQEADILRISGNVTVVWDVQPTDRITARLDFLHYNRGSWEPTVISMATQNFCSIMYDKNQYWYRYWTRYITNRHDVEKNCLRGPATVLVHEPFDLMLKLENFRGPLLRGRHKMVVLFNALDERNIPRPNPICLEIRGEPLKLN